MGPYNHADGLAWPQEREDVFVPKAERIQYDLARLITVDSPLRGKWIVDFVGSEYQQKMVINPSGVDTEMFQPRENRVSIKREFGIPDKKIVVGVASSFRWYNDVDELCQIIKKTKSKNQSINFILAVGDLNRIGSIHKSLRNYNISDSVKILSQVPFSKMPGVIDICDICISHFNFHGGWPHNCSIKHMEYLAMGKPVVATNVGYVNFAIENDINGLLIDEGDIDGFAKAILELANDAEKRKRLGASGRLKSETELSWFKNVEKFIVPLQSAQAKR